MQSSSTTNTLKPFALISTPALTLIFGGVQPIHDLIEMPFRYAVAKAGFGLQALGIPDKQCFASCFH